MDNPNFAARPERLPAPNWLESPGATLADRLETHELRFDAVAGQLGLDPEEFEDLMAGRMPLSQRIAERLEALTGIPDSRWLELDHNWRDALPHPADLAVPYPASSNEDDARVLRVLLGHTPE